MQREISTKRRRFVLCILLVVLAALGIFVFAACSDDITEATFKARGYKVAVTYDFQGGSVNGKTSVRILVKENSKLPAPRQSGGGIGIPSGKSGYSFKGFYLAETDEDGNVVRDDDGNIIVSDTEWNFDTDTVADKDITLCAKWWDNYKVVLHYGDNYEKSTEISLARNTDGSPVTMNASALRVQDYTFLSYNMVKDSTDEATAVSKFPFDFKNFVPAGDGLVIDVWGKSLTGNYVLVRSSRDLSISSVGEDTNYYLLDNIDMDGALYNDETSSNKIPKSYSGKFVGNGYTISNFTVNMKALDRTYSSFGLFRTLENGAEITDVTFKDIKLSFELSDANISNYHIGMLAGQSNGNVVVKNVNFVSSQGNSNVFEYLIGVGVNQTSLKIADDLLIAQKSASVVLQDCTVNNVKQIYSTGVVTDDEEFMLYVRYTVDNGNIILGEDAIYKMAQKNSSGKYSSKTIKETKFESVNKYVLTRVDNSVYDVTFTVNNGELSATMIKR